MTEDERDLEAFRQLCDISNEVMAARVTAMGLRRRRRWSIRVTRCGGFQIGLAVHAWFIKIRLGLWEIWAGNLRTRPLRRQKLPSVARARERMEAAKPLLDNRPLDEYRFK